MSLTPRAKRLGFFARRSREAAIRFAFGFLLLSLALCSPGFSDDLPEEDVSATMLILSAPLRPAPAMPAASNEPVSKRLFGVIPNFRADRYQAQYVPLTTRDKFEIARKDSFDWPNYLLLVGYAAQSEVAEPSHTGSKLSNFGTAYTRSVADQIVGSYVTEAIMPSLLHEDPRFFRLGAGSTWFRIYYATSRVFITRRDSGASGLALSELLGNVGVVALGNLYYTDDRSASESLERYSMALGNDVISNLLTEFWPDVKRHLPFVRH